MERTMRRGEGSWEEGAAAGAGGQPGLGEVPGTEEPREGRPRGAGQMDEGRRDDSLCTYGTPWPKDPW